MDIKFGTIIVPVQANGHVISSASNTAKQGLNSRIQTWPEIKNEAKTTVARVHPDSDEAAFTLLSETIPTAFLYIPTQLTTSEERQQLNPFTPNYNQQLYEKVLATRS